MEGKFWASFPSAASQVKSKKAFTPSYWGREHTNSTMFGLFRLKLNSALLPKTMSQQPIPPCVSSFYSSKNHHRNHHGLNGLNFALLSGVQSYNYLTPHQQHPLTQHSCEGWDNNDNYFFWPYSYTECETMPCASVIDRSKGKCLAALELLMN